MTTDKDLLRFILAELAKRPHVLNELLPESIVVNRLGTDGLSLESLELSDGEVLGKLNGKLTGLPFNSDSDKETIIEVSNTEVILTHHVAVNKSSKLILDITTITDEVDATRSLTFEMLLKVNSSEGIEFTRYAFLGSSINYEFEFASLGDLLIIAINNLDSEPIKVSTRVLK